MPGSTIPPVVRVQSDARRPGGAIFSRSRVTSDELRRLDSRRSPFPSDERRLFFEVLRRSRFVCLVEDRECAECRRTERGDDVCVTASTTGAPAM